MNGILIGRFQPFHLGHLEAIRFALSKVQMLWILVGSAQKSHELRNPFTAGERILMIKGVLDRSEFDPRRWHIVPLYDAEYHFLWTRQIDMLISKYEMVFTNDPLSAMLFKEQGKDVVEVPLHKRELLSGTEIRRRIASDEEWKEFVSEHVANVIESIKGVERIKMLNLHINNR